MITKKTSLRLGFGTLTFVIVSAIAIAFILFGLPNFFPNEKFGGRIGTDIMWPLFVLHLTAIVFVARYLVKIATTPREEADEMEEVRQMLRRAQNLRDSQEVVERLESIKRRRQQEACEPYYALPQLKIRQK